MKKYRVIRKKYGYIIVNEDLGTHVHMSTKKGCEIFLSLLEKDSEMKNSYFKKAKKRLLNLK